jgi:cell division protein FtsW
VIRARIGTDGRALILVTAGLLAAGAMAVLSASSFASMIARGNSHYYFVGHVMRVLLGIALAFGAWRMPLRFWKSISVPLYAVSVLLVLLTVIPGFPLAQTRNGSTIWLAIGPFSFMPSDLLRFSYVLLAAGMISRGIVVPRTLPGFLAISAAAVLPAGLILLQHDFAGAFYLVSMMAAMLFFGEARLSHICALVFLLASVAALFVLGTHYQSERIEAWLNQRAGMQEENYQPVQSCIALGSGGFMGRGLGRGRQQRGFLPEPFSDFILAVIGEETGFIGTTILILAFVAFSILAWRIAEKADDAFGSLTAAGFASSIAVGALLNIGVATRLFPTTGVTLPLISWGGTSILVTLVSIGIIVRVSGTARA